jgi:hypothetical protein
MDTGTTTEANEPIEVDDDVSHEASENKEISARWASLHTYEKHKRVSDDYTPGLLFRLITFAG